MLIFNLNPKTTEKRRIFSDSFFPVCPQDKPRNFFFVFFQLQFLLIYSTMAQGHGIKGWLTSSDKIPSNLFFVFFPKCFLLVAFTYTRGMLYKTSVDFCIINSYPKSGRKKKDSFRVRVRNFNEVFFGVRRLGTIEKLCSKTIAPPGAFVLVDTFNLCFVI